MHDHIRLECTYTVQRVRWHNNGGSTRHAAHVLPKAHSVKAMRTLATYLHSKDINTHTLKIIQSFKTIFSFFDKKNLGEGLYADITL